MNQLENKINKIGEDMIGDRKWADFDDIDYAPKKGIIPRGLYLENLGNSNSKGAIIVGLNPGRAKRTKELKCLSKCNNYKKVVECWKEISCNYSGFYMPLRNFIRKVGLRGFILWTNLVPCQNKSRNNKSPSIKTIRYSVNTYLKKQVDLIPKAPIIAVGRDPFRLLAYMFSDRKVIGITHPAPTNRPAANKAYRPIPNKKLVSLVKNELIKNNKEAIEFIYDRKMDKFVAQK